MPQPTTTVNYANELRRVYTKDSHFDPMQRTHNPHWDNLKEAEDVRPGGEGLYFPLRLRAGQAASTVASGGDRPTGSVRKTLQGVVRPIQFANTITLTNRVINAAMGEGSFSADAVADAVEESTMMLYRHIERMFVLSDGLGTLGFVESATVASPTFIGALPMSIHGLEEGMIIEFRDSVGTLRAGGPWQINTINQRTREVALVDPADESTPLVATLTANDGVFRSGSYAIAPIGLRALCDDGDVRDDFFGNSRATNPKLKATVDKNAGTPREYSERLIRGVLHAITHRVDDGTPTQLYSNTGIVDQHTALALLDRQYNVPTKGVPNWSTGVNESKLAFTFDNRDIPFYVSRDMPARELWVVNLGSLRKHTLQEVDWEDGFGKDNFMPVPSSTGAGYKLSKTASIVGDLAQSSRKPVTLGAIRDIEDYELTNGLDPAIEEP